MASPQTDDGYTSIAHEIIEQIAKQPLNGTQLRILLILFRYTYGFHRKEHPLSETFLAKAINVHKKQISRELSELVKFNMIIITSKANFTQSNVLQFNKDYDSWEVTNKFPVPQLAPSTGNQLAPSPVPQLAPQENYIKTITKTNMFNDERFAEFWRAYPKKIGKGAAEEKFKKFKPSQELLTLMLNAISKQLETEQWKKDNGQYIPNPATWLNQKRWEDEVPKEKSRFADFDT